jgi:hypothetical protein
MSNNIKSFLIKNVVDDGEEVSFDYKGFHLSINQADDWTNGDLEIQVRSWTPKDKYHEDPLFITTIQGSLGATDWDETI